MDAEIGFFHQHIHRFLDADAVALGQVLAKNAVKRAVDGHHLYLAQQVVRRGHLVPEGDGGRAVGRVGRQHPTRCIIPECDGRFFTTELRQYLWDKYFTAAPAQRRQYDVASSKVRKAHKA